MQLLRMKAQEKADLIQLAEFLENWAAKRQGRYYSKNAGCHRDNVYRSCQSSYYLLHPDNKWLRDGVIFYYQGWGWRVRSGWREVISQIETTE